MAFPLAKILLNSSEAPFCRRLFLSFNPERVIHRGASCRGLLFWHALKPFLLSSRSCQSKDLLITKNSCCRLLSVSNQAHCKIYFTGLLKYLKSSADNFEGSSYLWLNLNKDENKLWDNNGIFLVAVNVFLPNKLLPDSERSLLIDNLKYIQRRFPKLQIFGIQHAFWRNNPCDVIQINKMILKNFITFPVLVSSEAFGKVLDGAVYLLIDSFKDHLTYNQLDLDINNLIRDVNTYLERSISRSVSQPSGYDSGEELGLPENALESLREPIVCSFLRELLLFFPGSVSADKDGKHMFVSDTLHHRIIVADINGTVLDCIGSSPGFEDGPFHNARLYCPSSAVFNTDENCLYFADSENHAIRKADLQKKYVETVYPPVKKDEDSRIWKLIGKLKQKFHMETKNDSDANDREADELLFPWHLTVTENDDELLIANRGFTNLWLLDMEKSNIKQRFEGAHAIEVFWHRSGIEKKKLMDVIEMLRSKQTSLASTLVDLYPSCFISRLAILRDAIVFVDTDGQKLLKLTLDTGDISNICFSSIGCLGMPYWWPSNIELLSQSRNNISFDRENTQCPFYVFRVRPGRCEIGVNFILPRGTRLAARVEKGCVWRQTRGSVVELSMYDGMFMSDKVGMAQEFYDYLDEVIYTPTSEESLEFESKEESEDYVAHITSCLDISQGVGELALDVVLYLTLDESNGHQEDQAIVNFLQNKRQEPNSLMTYIENWKDLIFLKHAHARIRLKCSDEAPSEIKFHVNVKV